MQLITLQYSHIIKARPKSNTPNISSFSSMMITTYYRFSSFIQEGHITQQQVKGRSPIMKERGMIVKLMTA